MEGKFYVGSNTKVPPITRDFMWFPHTKFLSLMCSSGIPVNLSHYMYVCVGVCTYVYVFLSYRYISELLKTCGNSNWGVVNLCASPIVRPLQKQLAIKASVKPLQLILHAHFFVVTEVLMLLIVHNSG